jgi:hypothetical protein
VAHPKGKPLRIGGIQMTTAQQVIDRLKRVASIIQLDALEKNRTGVRNRGDELLALLILLEEKLIDEEELVIIKSEEKHNA